MTTHADYYAQLGLEDFGSFVTDSAGFRIPLRDAVTPGDRLVGRIDRLGVRFYRAAGDDVLDGPRYAVMVPAPCPVCHHTDGTHPDECPLFPCDTCGEAGFACECPPMCPTHDQPAVTGGYNSGFAGEGLAWVGYACGCVDVESGTVSA